MVQEIQTSQEFRDLIASGQKVIVDFHAEWCGPCKAIAPTYEKHDAAFSGITFVKVNVDTLSDVAQNAGVVAMPTFQTFVGGKKLGEIKGAAPAKLKELIDTLDVVSVDTPVDA